MAVAPDPQGMVARFPRLAVGRGRMYVVGVDIQTFDNSPVRENPFVAWELGGKSIGCPPGQFAFLFPRGGVDSRDRLHVVWAEPAEPTGRLEARKWYFLRPTSIWSAIHDPSQGWSEPKRLEHNPTITGLNWTSRGTADNLGAAHSPQGVAVPAMRPARNEPLLYLTLSDDGQWTRQTIPVPYRAGYVSVVTIQDRVFAVYTAAYELSVPSASQRTHSDVNSVFLLASHDGGRTWSAPRLVSRSGEHPAHQTHALLGPRAELHLIWKQETPRGAVVRHVLSRDGGTAWSAPQDLAPVGQFDNLRAVVDGCGAVHLVYEDWSAGTDRVHIDHATWDGRWSDPMHLSDSLLAMTPDIRIGPTGDPIVVFAARDVERPAASFATLYSRLEKAGGNHLSPPAAP